jgi:hypothetical protein
MICNFLLAKQFSILEEKPGCQSSLQLATDIFIGCQPYTQKHIFINMANIHFSWFLKNLEGTERHD